MKTTAAESLTEVFTAAQMRAIEQAAMAAGEVTGLELMERAGQAVAQAVLAKWPDGPRNEVRIGGQPVAFGTRTNDAPKATPRDISAQTKGLDAVILCGPGNNGGDGFVVARLLKRAGWDVDVFLYGDPARFSPDARANYDAWLEVGDVRPWSACDSRVFGGQPVVVDAVFGTGLTRALPREVRNVLMASMNCRRVAVDIPSFLSSDTGAGDDLPGAHLTVTFHRAKLGHYLGDGPASCGELVIADIGLGAHGIAPLSGHDVVQMAVPADMGKSVGHKYDHGSALVLCGGVGKGGAGRLAARAALRVGAGAVTVACPPAALIENAAQLDAVMLTAVKDADALSARLDDARISAVCMGPGLGLGPREAALVAAALDGGGNPRPTVLDADALTHLAGDDALFDALHGLCILTPHGGEFARLFPDVAHTDLSKVDRTRAAAKRAGCVVLYKGPDTVIAAPDGRVALHAAAYDRAAPWLATAGAGDVLAGLITGLLARGFDPFTAAQTAAWLHVESARSFGPGLIAEDLTEMLPKVLRDLEA